MTTGPWGTSARNTRATVRKAATSKVGRYVVTGLIVSLLFAIALYTKYTTDRAWEAKRAPNTAYAQIIDLAKTCPVLRGSIRAVMNDGYLTQGEAAALRHAAELRQKAYFEAAGRRDAAAAVGAPAVRVPVKCEGWSSTLFL